MRLEQWEIWYKKVTDTKGMVDIEEFNLMTESWSWLGDWKDIGDINTDENKEKKACFKLSPKSAVKCFSQTGIIRGLVH